MIATREIVTRLAKETGLTPQEIARALDEGRVLIDRYGRLVVLPPEALGYGKGETA